METRKVNLDRKNISSEEIQQRQDWDNVLGEVKKLKPPLSKNVWFYGPAALASVGALISVTLFAGSKNQEVKTQDLAIEKKTKSIDLKKEIVESEEKSKQSKIIHINNQVSEKTITIQEEKIDKVAQRLKKPLEEILQNSLFTENNERKKEVKEQKYVEPEFIFASISSKIEGELSIEELEKNPLLELNSRKSKIKRFEIAFFKEDGYQTIPVEGAKISSEIISKIKKTGLDSPVYFTKVECFSDDLKGFYAPSFDILLVK